MSFEWSAGKVAAALKLLYRIGNALRKAGGTSSDYQDTITFLQTLSHTIQHLNAIQVTSFYPEIAQNFGDRCEQIKRPLQAFLEDANKFDSGLGRHLKSKRKKILGTGRKVQWEMVIKTKLKALQDKVEIPMASISLVLGQHILTKVMLLHVDLRMSGDIKIVNLGSTGKPADFNHSQTTRSGQASYHGLISHPTLSGEFEKTNECIILHKKLDEVSVLLNGISTLMGRLPENDASAPMESESNENLADRRLLLWVLLSNLQTLIHEILIILLHIKIKLYKTPIQPSLTCIDYFFVENLDHRSLTLPCQAYQGWDAFYDLLNIRFLDTPLFGLLFAGRALRLYNSYNHAPISPAAWQAAVQPKTKMVIGAEWTKQGITYNCSKCNKNGLLRNTNNFLTYYIEHYDHENGAHWEPPTIIDTMLLEFTVISWLPIFFRSRRQNRRIAALRAFFFSKSSIRKTEAEEAFLTSFYNEHDPTEINKASLELFRPNFKGISHPIILLSSINKTFRPKLIKLPFSPEILKLGRSGLQPEWHNTVFNSQIMSRLHADIWADKKGRVWIRDAGSYHGTWINGKRLSSQREQSQGHEIRTGDLLEMGVNIFDDSNECGRTLLHPKVEAWVMFAGYHDR